MLEVRLIGTFDIQCDGKPVNLSSRAAQSLFAYLILTAGTFHRRERLAGMLWPDENDRKARTYLRNELWRIRKALSQTSGVEYLLADNLTVGFNQSSAYGLDVAALKTLSETGTAEELIQALSNYRGELLPGFYEDWVVLEREHLQVLFEQKIAFLLEILEKEHRWQDILDWTERWISLGQAPEAAYRALMVAYDALGDHAKVTSTYERCKQALHQLDLEPSEQTRVLAVKRNPRINIPIPLTSFIGRERELKEVAGLFSKSRLVTLTGSGGVGKTRLAIQVVPDVLERFPDGVWFLDLASLNNPALVASTLINLLRLRESVEFSANDQLLNYFRSRTSLIIFDNCEHLIEACSQLISSLLTSCEKLSILATSRETLRVSGEITYRVPSLAIPRSNIEVGVDAFSKIESVQLFVERAALAAPNFAKNSQDVSVITEICQRLDGIPLALELAAARVSVLTVEQILRHVDNRFDLLTNGLRSSLPRHQTLRATIEWSYGLLSEKERVLFRRLAVFMDGWTLDSAEKVCTADNIASSDILELLSQLVNKSLILTEQSTNQMRYHMLETLRQFANEKLIGSREHDALRDRHLEYFLNLAATAEPYLIRPEQVDWLPLLDADYENLRLAFEWALCTETDEPSLSLCGALGWFWIVRGYWLEGLNWLNRALAKPSQHKSINEKTVRARALCTQSNLEWQLGHFDQILSPSQTSFALALEVQDRKVVAIAKFYMGIGLRQLVNDDRADSLLEESFAEFQSLNEPFWQAYSFPFLGEFLVAKAKLNYHDMMLRSIELARKVGERVILADALSGYAQWLFRINRVDEARKAAEESDSLYALIGSENSSINPLLFADIAWSNGDYKEANAIYLEQEKRFSWLGENGFRSICIGRLGLLAMEQGDLHQAQKYLEEALILEREKGWKPWIAYYLTELSNLFYRQRNIEQFKHNFRVSLSLRDYFLNKHKVLILMTILGSLYFQKPEISARLLGVIYPYSEPEDAPYTPVENRYRSRAEAYARNVLGNARFQSAFAEGQKMSLDKGLDLALKTVEEI